MKKLFPILIVAILVVSCSRTITPIVTPVIKKYDGLLASIAPLEYQDRPVCSTSRINAEHDYWLTAAHCTTGAYGEPLEGEFKILGQPAKVIMRAVTEDIAILQGCKCEATAPALELRLSAKPPIEGDWIVMAGYPGPLRMDRTQYAVTFGWVSNRSIIIEGFPLQRLLVQVVGAPGSSGSPLLDQDGRVVSVLQLGLGGWSSILVGASYDTTVYLAKNYFSQEPPIVPKKKKRLGKVFWPV